MDTYDEIDSPLTDRDELTKHEIVLLEKAQTAADWGAACDFIKGRRGGDYPCDWWDKVKLSGMMDRVMSRWGADSDLTLLDGDTGEEIPI